MSCSRRQGAAPGCSIRSSNCKPLGWWWGHIIIIFSRVIKYLNHVFGLRRWGPISLHVMVDRRRIAIPGKEGPISLRGAFRWFKLDGSRACPDLKCGLLRLHASCTLLKP